MTPLIPLRLGLQQRVLPSYRVPFFDALARACAGGLGLFAGQPRPGEMIDTGAKLQAARHFEAGNRHILRGTLYLCWQAKLIEWLEAWQPDVLVVEANPRYLQTPRAVRWMHRRRRPVIGWGLGAPVSGGPLAGWRSTLRQRFLAQFDAVVAYSRQGTEDYLRAGFPPERVFTAPNAVAPRPQRAAPQRPVLFSGGQASVLFVGRLQARKRIDLLLQACASLPSGQRPHLTIIGEGPARAEWESLAGRIYPETQFLGAIQGTALEPFYLAADVFVLPGTGGLAVQQAMAYALPVIVAEGDGTQSDLVRPGNGWQVSPGSAADLSACLAAALADPVGLRKMGSESFRIVSEEINLEKMVEAFASAIKSVI